MENPLEIDDLITAKDVLPKQVKIQKNQEKTEK